VNTANSKFYKSRILQLRYKSWPHLSPLIRNNFRRLNILYRDIKALVGD